MACFYYKYCLPVKTDLGNYSNFCSSLHCKGIFQNLFSILTGIIFTVARANSRLNNSNDQVRDYFGRNNEGLFICKACGKTLKEKTKLRIHAEIHVEGLSYQCKTCTKIFSTQNRLWSHIHNNHGGSDASTGELSVTDKGESDEELIPSDLNREISKKIQKLLVKKNHNTWKCRKCLKTSTQKFNLLSHLETHLNYIHHCPLCKTTARTRKSLREHYRVTHNK